MSLALAMSLAAAAQMPLGSEVDAPGPNGPLRGTLALPAKGGPVILIIPGSGPTDRDGNNPLGVRAAPYRMLAEDLSKRGIASLRIDKRGMFGSGRAIPDANAVTFDDYVRDVGVWVNAIRARTRTQCIWILGHSEGGLVALAAAKKVDHICGLILVAAPGRPLGDVLKEQLRANPANAALLEVAGNAIDALSKGRHVDEKTLPPPLAPLFNAKVQGFLISVISLDPAVLIAKSTKPTLILQGGRDLQVSAADAERLKQAAPQAKIVILPTMNHVLKQVASDDQRANLATYAAVDLPLATGLIDEIASFVTSH